MGRGRLPLRSFAASGRQADLAGGAAAALTAALGSSLFFVSEPAAAKTVLPWLGGTPAAWGATLLFFQLALIAGYWVVGRALQHGGPRGVALVQTAALTVAAIAVALSRPFGSTSVPEGVTLTGTLGVMAAELGLPVFALAMTAPAIQTWITSRGSHASRTTYVYYAASNAGSLIGLLAYPWLIEPRIPLSSQWGWWRLGLWLLVVIIVLLWLSNAGRLRSSASQAATPAVSRPDRTHWILRAALPAALLAAVTAYITRDIAPVPFLWVIPLALYLVTWIVAFSPRTTAIVAWAGKVQDLSAVVAVVIFLNPPGALVGGVLALIALVVVGIVQHGALAASAPPESQLGQFYVALAVGGAAGTALVVGLGPVLLPVPAEAPIVLAVAVALGSPPRTTWSTRGRIIFLAFAAVAVLIPLLRGLTREQLQGSLAIAAGVAAMIWRAQPRRVALALLGFTLVDASLKLTAPDYLGGSHGVLGRFVVRRYPDGTGLISGSTSHGFEPRTPDGSRPEAGLYYTRGGAYGDLVRLVSDGQGRPRLGVIGLGVGSLGCTAPPGSAVTFFEINPGVIRLARDTTLFRSLARCAPEAAIRLGDARLTLTGESGEFDFLTIDAFNSDAIPTHLLTREAFALYRERTARDGIIAFHLSNRYLDLVPVVVSLARETRWASVETRTSFPSDSVPRLDHRGEWITLVAVARDTAALVPLVESGRWQWTAEPVSAPWTDDWTPLASTLRLTRANIFGR